MRFLSAKKISCRFQAKAFGKAVGRTIWERRPSHDEFKDHSGWPIEAFKNAGIHDRWITVSTRSAASEFRRKTKLFNKQIGRTIESLFEFITKNPSPSFVEEGGGVSTPEESTVQASTDLTEPATPG